MNLLLTGATGYLGRRVATRLAADGHRLSALVRRGSDTTALQGLVPAAELHVVEDLHLDRLLARGSFSAVIHLAACYGRKGEGLQTVFEANCVFPMQLLQAACRHRVPNFINAGTSLPPALGAYALSKGQFSSWGRLAGECGEIAFVDLAMEHFYGPDDTADKFVTRVIRHCLHNTAPLPLTTGQQRRDFIYVDDVVAAFPLLLEQLPHMPCGYKALGVGSGTAITIRELVETIQRLTGTATRLDFGTVAVRSGEPEELRADIATLQTLGWRCQTSLVAGLTQTIAAERGVKEHE